MGNKEIKRNLAIFPISTLINLTGLSARQIRYFEKYELIIPKRSQTNRRLYSLNDIDQLLDIMEMIEQGMTLKGIKQRFSSINQPKSPLMASSYYPLTDQDVRRILQDELDIRSRY